MIATRLSQKSSLSLPLFIEVPAQARNLVVKYMYVSDIDCVSISSILDYIFGTFQTVWRVCLFSILVLRLADIHVFKSYQIGMADSLVTFFTKLVIKRVWLGSL